MAKTTMNNNTITAKSVNPRVAGLGLHNKARRSFNAYLHATKFVIRRVDITYNKQTKQFEEDSYFSIVDDSPLIREFGLSDIHKCNFLAFDIDGDGNKKKARRINIDGQRYVMSVNIMAIQCENQRKLDELADKGYEVDGELYIAVNASPSNEKHAVKYYARITPEMPDEETAFWKIDKLMGGSLSDKLMKDPKTGAPILVNGKDITRANTRIGNYASGMKLLGHIDLTKERVAYVNGSMNQACDFDEATKEQMKAMGIEIDDNVNDGAGYLAASKVVEMFKTLDVKLTEEQAMKVALQTRWTVFTAKIMARTLKTETLEQLAEFYNADIYGNPDGELVALIDKDGAKMVNFSALRNHDTLIDLYVMNMANTSGVRTCGQHLIKYMSVNPTKTIEIAKKLATLSIDEFVSNKLESDNANTDLVNARIMANLDASEVYSDAFLMEALLSDTWTYAKSMIAENKFPIDGVYTHMMFDLSYALVNGAIDSILRITNEGFIEAYNPDVLRLYADEIKAIEEDDTLTEEEKDAKLFEILSGTVVKFPSAMPREYEIIVYKTDRQIRRAIADTNLTNEEKTTLQEYFDATPWGCTVYAPVNAMKNKLAGADVDFDATMCDMSELKWILIDQRIKEQETKEGYMGDCTFISYKDIVRTHLDTTNEVTTEVDDLDM